MSPFIAPINACVGHADNRFIINVKFKVAVLNFFHAGQNAR